MKDIPKTVSLTKDYGTKTKHRVLDHISLTIQDGERLAIVGPSRSGKTTLMRLLSSASDYRREGLTNLI